MSRAIKLGDSKREIPKVFFSVFFFFLFFFLYSNNLIVAYLQSEDLFRVFAMVTDVNFSY